MGKSIWQWAQVSAVALILGLMLQTTRAWAAADAAEVEVPPAAVVQQVTDEMMAVIKGGDQALKNNPDQYFEQLETILEKSVHFDYISKYVMGDFWNGASAEQRQAFAARFKRSMVETIGKGLANYSDLQLTISPDDIISKNNVAIVKQAVVGAKQPVSISYWMARTKEGEWKLIDVVLDGVKLRETFRSQFKADMNKQANDYNAVIDNWSNSQQIAAETVGGGA